MRIALIALILSGCGTWQKSDTPPSQFDKDRYACLQDSSRVQDEIASGMMFNECMRLKGWKR